MDLEFSVNNGDIIHGMWKEGHLIERFGENIDPNNENKNEDFQ